MMNSISQFQRFSFAYDEGFFRDKRFVNLDDMTDVFSVSMYSSPSAFYLYNTIKMMTAKSLDYRLYLKDKNKEQILTLCNKITPLLEEIPDDILHRIILENEDNLFFELIYKTISDLAPNRDWANGFQRILNIEYGKMDSEYVSTLASQIVVANIFSVLENDGKNEHNSQVEYFGCGHIDVSNFKVIPKRIKYETLETIISEKKFKRKSKEFLNFLQREYKEKPIDSILLDRTKEYSLFVLKSIIYDIAKEFNFPLSASYDETKSLPDEEKAFPLIGPGRYLMQ